MTDIPLPEPAMWYARGNVFSLEAIMQQGWHLEATGLFDVNKMRAYAEACVAAERERCAKKPLTAQQLDKLIEAHVGGAELKDGEYSAMVMFAAAVERAHGIGA